LQTGHLFKNILSNFLLILSFYSFDLSCNLVI
jgi:hypothetical protein